MSQARRRADLVRWSDSYYNDNVSLVPDHVFDEAQSSYFADYTDPALKSTIGSPVVKNSPWEKALHKIPMGSLDKIAPDDDADDRFEEFRKWHSTLNGESVILSEKLDGISIDLEYQEGIFVRGITRGDGVEGEDITVNVKQMKGFVPQLINNDTVSVRGEVILLEDDFNSIVELQTLRGDDPIKNPRNGAGGKARDREGIYAGYLTIKCYDATVPQTQKFYTMKWLEGHGFKTPQWRYANTAEVILDIYTLYENELRADLNYEIDGLVLELNESDAREKLGYKDGKPYFARAFKFSSLKAPTILDGIEWSLGKSGTITPVALLKPVHMGGVTVQRASLANAFRFTELDLNLDDEVLISRRGDVIPYVESVIKKGSSDKFDMPIYCPECNQPTRVEGKFLLCNNEQCEGKIVGNIMKWVVKSGMGGKGVGQATIEKLVAVGAIEDPADLYILTANQVVRVDGFQIRSATKLVETIQAHRTVSLANFVGGLNLGHFGTSLTQLLVDAGHDTIDKLRALHVREIETIDGFGLSRAMDFVDTFADKDEVIATLLNYVTIENKKEIAMTPTANGLTGKSFCFTGAIQKVGDNGKRLTRKNMEKLVLMNDGDVSSVKKGLTYLVQADPESQSSKTKKAISLGVEILSEANFFKMVE